MGTCVEVVGVSKYASRTGAPKDRASVSRVATQYTSQRGCHPASLPARGLLEIHVTGLTIQSRAGAEPLC
jgi:hypothetical protein